MRLICPNCGAQYDVPPEVIPEGGRDVQCSNCGHTWFQHHPDDDASLTGDADLPPREPEWETEGDEDQTQQAPLPAAARPRPSRPRASDFASDADSVSDSDSDDTFGDAPPDAHRDAHGAGLADGSEYEPDYATDAPESAPGYATEAGREDQFEDGSEYHPRAAGVEDDMEADTAKPRGLDPEVAGIFREEREYEARRRAAETLESQPDLGLPDPDEGELARRARQSRDRMAALRADGTDGDPAARPSARHAPRRPAVPVEGNGDGRAVPQAAASSRRDLLPNVDEINQTLRATNEPRVIDTAPRGPVKEADPGKGGFGRGFLTVLVLAALAVGLYVYAPRISAAVPQAAPVLDTYVAAVDKGRAWLDGQVTALLVSLDGMSSEAGDAPVGTADTTAPVGEEMAPMESPPAESDPAESAPVAPVDPAAETAPATDN